MILGKRYRMHGTDVIDRGCCQYPVFDDHDLVSMVNMFLYLMKNKEWMRDISLYSFRHHFYIICYAKKNIKIEPLIEIMQSNILRVKKHLKEIGINTAYKTQDFDGVIMSADLVRDKTRIRFWLKRGTKTMEDKWYRV